MNTADQNGDEAPLLGPGGLWAAASASGGTIPSFARFIHQGSGRDLPVAVAFGRQQGGSHVQNELAEFLIGPEGVSCIVTAGLPEVYCGRIQALMPFLLPFFGARELDGAFAVSLGDEGLNARVLSFCSIIPDFLVPDPYFVGTQGYGNERDLYAQIPWADRRDQLYWRGTDTGVWRYKSIAEAPRVAICHHANGHPELIDARITRIEPSANEVEKRAYYTAHGLIGPEADQAEILHYRYQIDIDGNTSTWSSFFLKLLTGSPVLKVDSEGCWKQWYYDRLEPGEHFVPVRADLADLAEKLEWLRANPFEAQRIGLAGRAFALSMDFASEMQHAIATVGRLVALNRRMAFG